MIRKPKFITVNAYQTISQYSCLFKLPISPDHLFRPREIHIKTIAITVGKTQKKPAPLQTGSKN